jgi:hypothetical protein
VLVVRFLVPLTPAVSYNLRYVARNLRYMALFFQSALVEPSMSSNSGQPWCSNVNSPALGDRLFMQTPQSCPRTPASSA